MTGTFDLLQVGDSFETPSVTVDERVVAELVSLGGYTHPLFTDPTYAAASPFGRTPLPGPALLLLVGGLTEQSGRFDETTIALTGYDQVRFKAPVVPGHEIRVALEVTDKQERGSRGLMTLRMTCSNASGEVLLEATATFLFERAAS